MGRRVPEKSRTIPLAHRCVTYKVAFRGCVSLLPLLFGSTEFPVREVLGREGPGEKEVGVLLALRVRNESSERNSTTVRHAECER